MSEQRLVGVLSNNTISLFGTITIAAGEKIIAESPTVIPSIDTQIVKPSAGYNCLAQVIVEAIPYIETVDQDGGITVMIG